MQPLPLALTSVDRNLFARLDQRYDDTGIGKGRGVTHVVELGRYDLANDLSHDLARTDLGQRLGKLHVVKLGNSVAVLLHVL